MIKFAVTQDWNPSGPKQLVLKLWAILFSVKTITFPLFPMKETTSGSFFKKKSKCHSPLLRNKTGFQIHADSLPSLVPVAGTTAKRAARLWAPPGQENKGSGVWVSVSEEQRSRPWEADSGSQRGGSCRPGTSPEPGRVKATGQALQPAQGRAAHRPCVWARV